MINEPRHAAEQLGSDEPTSPKRRSPSSGRQATNDQRQAMHGEQDATSDGRRANTSQRLNAKKLAKNNERQTTSDRRRANNEWQFMSDDRFRIINRETVKCLDGFSASVGWDKTRTEGRARLKVGMDHGSMSG